MTPKVAAPRGTQGGVGMGTERKVKPGADVIYVRMAAYTCHLYLYGLTFLLDIFQ